MMGKANTVSPCPVHPEQMASMTCAQCAKPICRLCIEQFGYFCSQACKDAAKQAVPAEDPVRKAAVADDYNKALRRLKIGGLVLLGACLVIVAAVIWKYWLDPVGKIAWQWQTQTALNTTRILNGNDGVITVLADDRIVTLNPQTGVETAAFKLPASTADSATAAEDPEAEDFDFSGDRRFYPGGALLEPLPDGFLLVRGGTVRKLGADGSVKLEKNYPGGRIKIAAKTTAGDRCYYLATAPAEPEKMRQARAELQKLETGAAAVSPATAAKIKALYEQLQNNRTWLVALNLAANRELWNKELNRGISIPQLIAATGTVTAVFNIMPTSGEALTVLCAIQPDSGEKAWQIKLPEALRWGPVAVGGVILFTVGDELHAVGDDGTEKYILPLPEKAFAQAFIKDGLLFMVTGAGSKCCDPATGKTLWSLGMALEEEDMVVAGKRIFVRAEVEEALAGGDLKPPPGFDQLKEMKEFEGVMKKSRMVSMLLAVDRDSGKELWRRRSVFGRLVGDEKHLLSIADTSSTSMLERIGGGKGKTVLRQFSVSGGGDIFTREYDVGLVTPFLVGKRLAAVCFERQYQGGLMNMMSSSGHSGKEKPVPAQGVVAFKIK